MGELIVNGIKWAFIIGLAVTFMTAIYSLINFIIQVATTNVIGEVLGIISNSLPFDASAVIGGAFTASTAVLSFMVAQKIYDLTSNRITV